MKDIIKGYFPPKYNIYVEGFGGSASILLSIPKPNGCTEVYNDLGQNVYSLYKVLGDRDTFIRLKDRMDLSPYSYQMWKEYKDSLRKDVLTLEERAYRFLYVNRTSFNGVGGFSVNTIIRRGMSKSTSDYLSMIDRLPEIHNRLSSVIIENRDINDVIEKYDSETTFFYLDPPYVKETRLSSQTYEVEMSNDDHNMLIDTIINAKGMFLISGYDHPIYDRLLEHGFRKESFKSPNAGSFATETLWYNYNTGQKSNLDLGQFF